MMTMRTALLFCVLAVVACSDPTELQPSFTVELPASVTAGPREPRGISCVFPVTLRAEGAQAEVTSGLWVAAFFIPGVGRQGFEAALTRDDVARIYGANPVLPGQPRSYGTQLGGESVDSIRFTVLIEYAQAGRTGTVTATSKCQ